MISARRAQASRVNGRASKGPRTAAGKAVSSRNARRHGLNVPLAADPRLAAEIAALARLIAGEDAGADLLACAEAIAQAQLDLRRIRQARHALFAREVRTPAEGAGALTTDTCPADALARIAEAIAQNAREFAVLARYERRAVSRRTSAIRAFDRLRARQALMAEHTPQAQEMPQAEHLPPAQHMPSPASGLAERTQGGPADDQSGGTNPGGPAPSPIWRNEPGPADPTIIPAERTRRSVRERHGARGRSRAPRAPPEPAWARRARRLRWRDWIPALPEQSLRRLVPLILVPLILVLIACAVGAPALAQQAASRHTSTKAQQCRAVKMPEPDSAASVCRGLAGLVVVVAEEDVRQSVSVGRTRAAAEKEPAATTFFGPPSFAHEAIEWRLDAKTRRPAAIIQRWTLIPSEEPRRDILVVTRLPPGPVCHVAYIDVAKNPDAAALARKAADEEARTFDCSKDARVIGARGAEIAVTGR
ncbi:MAG TPA: hypothetical protein VNR11_19660 [Xanthobacteraceae bacterium]|nr:hypothetical protein [Xanthobacteraceae bacterium]